MTTRTINPIILGFAPDPSIVSVSGWYFLVTSSFHLFPRLPVYASEDLVSWKQIGNAINRSDQLKITKSTTRLNVPSASAGGKVRPATAGLYAPTIRHHIGTFYIVCTNALFDKERDVWSSSWSNPVYFDFVGIDPDIFFDENAKVYVTGSATPGPWTRINCFQIDIETGTRLSEEQTLWTGTGGIYPKGPHIYKRKGCYYLLIAEGGTHLNHMITMARSRTIWGPYEPCPDNPILTASGTGEYVQHTGHGDLFEDHNGHWWVVCLAVRKDRDGRFAMSRETFLTSAEWDSEWPSVQPVKLRPEAMSTRNDNAELSAAGCVDYVYIRDASLSNYQFSEASSNITLTASSVDLTDPEASPTFIGKRQRTLAGKCSASIAGISSAWASTGMKCGLAYYKDEHRYFRIFLDASDSSIGFEEKNTAQEIHKTIRQRLEKTPDLISLLMDYTEQEFQLMYTTASGPDRTWTRLAAVDTLDMTDPDFVGPVIGIFAVSDSEGSIVDFKEFQCN